MRVSEGQQGSSSPTPWWLLAGLAIGYALGRLAANVSARPEVVRKAPHPNSTANGKRTSRLMNAQRIRCDCGFESTPGGVGSHQKATGHTGRERVA